MNQIPQKHRFVQYIRIIGKGKTGRRSLTENETQAAMSHILAGDNADPMPILLLSVFISTKLTTTRSSER